MLAVAIVRVAAAAADSLAEILARIKLGIAIAAMIRMIATTINNSINEKPFCFFIIFKFPFPENLDATYTRIFLADYPLRSTLHATFTDQLLSDNAEWKSFLFNHLHKHPMKFIFKYSV